ncbi:MAG TPA: ATP-binding protein [Verrucomicrobiae bacterium]|nr:ATP-binding protein [Verrucomicrobiae bacterium]
MKEPLAEPSIAGPMPETSSGFNRYAFAVAATIVAFLIRLSLDSILKDRVPNAAIVIATVLVAWYGGFIPSCLAAFLGFLLCNWFFVPPRHSLLLSDVDTTNHVIGNISFFFVECAIILFGWSMHLARARANANAREAIEHLKRLQQEIMERQRAEEQVRRLNAELEKRVEQRTAELVAANEELESFTYSVSHDLRAPLRHIDGFAQLLQEDFGPSLPPEGREFTAKIRSGTRNMGQLVDDLLNLSRIGKHEIHREQAALNPEVEAAMAEVVSEAAGRRIEWKTGTLPAADCDPGLVKQIFINLLSNAIKYTRPRAEARIEVGHVDANGETAFFVRDNGVGFNMKYVGKLFGVFQRLHRAEEFEGTGVGLATVARIVRRHGGRIWVEAEEGKGAAFFFTLAPPSRTGPAQVNGELAGHKVSQKSQNTA